MKPTSLTIVMPCLNEELTLRVCIQRAKRFLETVNIPTEIIVADNGSTDQSTEICRSENVNCLHVPEKGYGAALHYGIMAASGSHIIFGDSDDSYHFDECMPFYDAFKNGAELVVGNRFRGGLEKGAMPWLHRYLGTPVISFMGRKSFEVPFTDFNCGLRGISKEAYMKLDMHSRGMDFITEMLAKAGYKKLSITEVPVRLYKDGRNRPPHLKTWQDGWRQLRLIIMLSPRWLLLIPSIVFFAGGTMLFLLLLFSRIRIASITLDVHSFFFGAIFMMLGLQLFQFYLLLRFYGYKLQLHSLKPLELKMIRMFRFERGLVIGALVIASGIGLSLYAVLEWTGSNFGNLDPMHTFRIIIPGGLFIMAGTQIVVFSFLLNALVAFNVKFIDNIATWINRPTA